MTRCTGSAAALGVAMALKGTQRLSMKLGEVADGITKGGTLRVGFLENAKYTDRHPVRGTPRAPLHIATVAFWQEFGTLTVPSRPFFRTTIADKSKDWGHNLGVALRATNMDGEQALRLLGQSMRDDVENSIATWTTPPNAQATIDIKGFDDPLVDGGDMQRAVDYDVVQK
jgi:hypothetical protein